MTDKADTKLKFINEIAEDEIGLDIGQGTIKVFKQYLEDSNTIVWNGPKELLEIITNTKATTIIGGGDIASAAINFGYQDKISHISTGGGASLAFLESKELPALKVIEEKK